MDADLGRLPHNVYDRCVNKFFSGICRDEAPAVCGGLCIKSNAAGWYSDGYFRLCFVRALNEVYAAGAQPEYMVISAFVPAGMPESCLKDALRLAGKLCADAGVKLVRGHFTARKDAPRLMICLTVFGEGGGKLISPKAGDILICAGELAAGGMGIIMKLCADRLQERFSSGFLREAALKYENISLKNICAALEGQQCFIMPLSEGGVLAAMWDLKNACGAGFEADIRLFPKAQQTVELSEALGVNPYRLAADGAALLAVKGEDEGCVMDRLCSCGICAARVGVVTDKADGNIRKDDEISSVSRPLPDELYRFLQQKGAC